MATSLPHDAIGCGSAPTKSQARLSYPNERIGRLPWSLSTSSVSVRPLATSSIGQPRYILQLMRGRARPRRRDWCAAGRVLDRMDALGVARPDRDARYDQRGAAQGRAEGWKRAAGRRWARDLALLNDGLRSQ
jgi:hypothetical protein